MGTERLDAEIKTRVQSDVKRAFEDLARTRHLDLADIAREAFREYLAKNPPIAPTEPVNGKVADV